MQDLARQASDLPCQPRVGCVGGLEGRNTVLGSSLPAVWTMAWKQRDYQDCTAVRGDTWTRVVTVQVDWKSAGLRTI